MLKVKSFAITDSDGVNELLTSYRLAQGAQILVSNGFILIPYDDGTEATASQRIAFFSEAKNELLKKVDVIQHDISVLSVFIPQKSERIKGLENDFEEAKKNKDNKVTSKLNPLIAAEKSQLAGLEQVKFSNETEVRRMTVDIQVYDDMINMLTS